MLFNPRRVDWSSKPTEPVIDHTTKVMTAALRVGTEVSSEGLYRCPECSKLYPHRNPDPTGVIREIEIKLGDHVEPITISNWAVHLVAFHRSRLDPKVLFSAVTLLEQFGEAEPTPEELH